jgi:hypothetical protein
MLGPGSESALRGVNNNRCRLGALALGAAGSQPQRYSRRLQLRQISLTPLVPPHHLLRFAGWRGVAASSMALLAPGLAVRCTPPRRLRLRLRCRESVCSIAL